MVWRLGDGERELRHRASVAGEVNVQELIRRADRALYRAKEEGATAFASQRKKRWSLSLATSG